MFRKYSRIIAAIVVVFFTWTSAGVCGIANAAVIESKKKSIEKPVTTKTTSPEEKLQKVTEELQETLANSKSDLGKKKEKVKAAKSAIEAADPEIRKEFAATEKKLKDAKLPAEILERHRKFVKHYNDNLAELRNNIGRVEKAKNKAEMETEIGKVEKHLKKIKAPSRHSKFDPNNLPHRQPKANKHEPRMKKEEFDKDLKKDKHAWRNQKRVMVASNGSLAGLLTSDDLAETIEVQLTPEIKAKALELGNNPVRIYEWVRNNIEFVPTWGSIQGAQMTMLTKQGNAFDTASLLIALLRAAGIHAHYVTGTIELPIDKVMNWAGGFSDSLSALDFMSSGGVPTKGLTSGGKVVAARMEHVWVEAFINYIPSRGAKHVNGKGDTWIRLDPTYKQYTYTQGIDLKTAVPFDGQSFLDQIKAGSTINESQGYVTGVNSLLVQQTMQDYQTRVQNYIQQNYPNATVGDVLGKKTIVKKEYPYLLGTLPYRTAVKGSSFSSIPDTLRHKLSFNVRNETVDTIYDPDTPDSNNNSLVITKSLPELAGKKITLSYSPATAQDEAVINSYLPKPHADGTPIQLSELPSSLPAYLINVKPELRVDGQVVATGEAIGLGGTNIFTMTFSDPTYGASQVVNSFAAGEYQAIGLNLGRISQEQLTDIKTRLEATKARLQNQDTAGLTKDDVIGELLYTTAIAYHAELGTLNYVSARTMNVNAFSLPSETIFAVKLNVLTLWGIPRNVSTGGLNMDADHLMQVVKAKDGNPETSKRYMLSSGMNSSALEHRVPEQLFTTTDNPVEGISTVKALKMASDQGIPIYTINQSNITTVLPQLQIDQQVKDDIQNAINAGKVVTVSKTNINFKGWNGCGYIIISPETGAGAYMISGGINGAMIVLPILLKAFISVFAAIASVFDIYIGFYKTEYQALANLYEKIESLIEKYFNGALKSQDQALTEATLGLIAAVLTCLVWGNAAVVVTFIYLIFAIVVFVAKILDWEAERLGYGS